ncbi:MAG: EutP/PduV family microcompartment system protein [Acutalibacteraceae bacterium]|nr:EutP/PduV family microcompartment system protein [Acutalibacteraceae bacterium]
MKKLILIGRSGVGKTTLTQALKGEKTEYHKTQYIDYGDFLIDTPGEYAENHDLGAALCLYAYEADVVALLIAADEQYSLFPPNVTCMVNREVIGIVTKCNKADPSRAEKWLRLSGCKTVYKVDSKTREGINQVLEHLKTHKKQEK